MISELLSKIDCRLIIADRTGAGWQPAHPVARITSIAADLTSGQGWSRVLQDIDIVFHLAGMEYNRSLFNWEADLASNFLAVARMLEISKSLPNPPRIVFASSLNVIGDALEYSIDESQLETPRSLWSVHKLMAEKYLRVYALCDGIPSTSLRIANVFGPSANASANNRVVLNRVICDALDGRPLKLYANRSLKRDFIHVIDAAKAFLAAGCSSENRMLDGRHFNIGSGQALSFQEVWELLAREIESVTGRQVSIKYDDSVKIEPLDMRSFHVNISAMEEVCGWRPELTAIEGLRQSVDHFFRTRERIRQ
jgi:nucleoside-diphosphate-sugar epimerase